MGHVSSFKDPCSCPGFPFVVPKQWRSDSLGSSVLIDRIALYKLFSTAHVLSYDPSEFTSYTSPLMHRWKMSNRRFLQKAHSEDTICLFLCTTWNSSVWISTRRDQEQTWIERGINETLKGVLPLLSEVCTQLHAGVRSRVADRLLRAWFRKGCLGNHAKWSLGLLWCFPCSPVLYH